MARLSLGTDYSNAVGISRLSPLAAVLPLWVARNLVKDRLEVTLLGAERAARRGHEQRARSIAEVKQRVGARPHHRRPTSSTPRRDAHVSL